MALVSISPQNKPREWQEYDFYAWLRKHWQPGEHIGIAAPTGWGKTWLSSHITGMRQWAVMFSMKQEDDTVKQYRGFKVLDSWRDRHYSNNHVIVWPYARTLDEALEVKYREGKYLLDSVFIERRWTLDIDDLNDLCFIGLKHEIAMMLRLCRSQKTSIIVKYQRPFGVIQEALSQVSYTLAAYHRDKRDIDRLAEANGLAPREALALNNQLRRYDFLFFQKMDDPIIVRREGRG